MWKKLLLDTPVGIALVNAFERLTGLALVDADHLADSPASVRLPQEKAPAHTEAPA